MSASLILITDKYQYLLYVYLCNWPRWTKSFSLASPLRAVCWYAHTNCCSLCHIINGLFTELIEKNLLDIGLSLLLYHYRPWVQYPVIWPHAWLITHKYHWHFFVVHPYWLVLLLTIYDNYWSLKTWLIITVIYTT